MSDRGASKDFEDAGSEIGWMLILGFGDRAHGFCVPI